MNTKEIAQMEVKYGDTGKGYVTMRARRQEDGTHEIHITDAFMEVKDGNEVKDIISDFKRRLSDKAEAVKVGKPKVKKVAKQTRHIWTEEEKADAVRRYSAGEDIEQIAKDYGSTRASVLKMMQKLKVKRPKAERKPVVIQAKKKVYHHWTPEEKKEVARRYSAGESVASIALDYEVTTNAIGRLCQKMGVPRPEGGTVVKSQVPRPTPSDRPMTESEAKSVMNAMDEADKQRKAELKAYRENKKKVWFMN